MPALFTAQSKRLYVLVISLINSKTFSSLVTSHLIKLELEPISLFTRSPETSSISAIITFAPSAANNLAVASPMPDPPPVIKATLSLRSIFQSYKS